MNGRIVRKRQYHCGNNEVMELSTLRCKEQAVYALVETLMRHAIQIGPDIVAHSVLVCWFFELPYRKAV